MGAWKNTSINAHPEDLSTHIADFLNEEDIQPGEFITLKVNTETIDIVYYDPRASRQSVEKAAKEKVAKEKADYAAALAEQSILTETMHKLSSLPTAIVEYIDVALRRGQKMITKDRFELKNKQFLVKVDQLSGFPSGVGVYVTMHTEATWTIPLKLVTLFENPKSTVEIYKAQGGKEHEYIVRIMDPEGNMILSSVVNKKN